MAKCQGKRLETGRVDGKFKVNEIECSNLAVTFRKDFRFGDRAKGEPSIVKLQVPLCQDCANNWDDRQAEGAAESRAS